MRFGNYGRIAPDSVTTSLSDGSGEAYKRHWFAMRQVGGTGSKIGAASYGLRRIIFD